MKQKQKTSTRDEKTKSMWRLCSTIGMIVTIPTFLFLLFLIPMTAQALSQHMTTKDGKEKRTKNIVISLFVLLFLIAGIVALVWAFFYKPDLYCYFLFITILLSIVSSVIMFPKKDRTKSK